MLFFSCSRIDYDYIKILENRLSIFIVQHQMAFANLGRNKVKTVLVMVSLALSVVLLNVLVIFVGGFDMEKYLANRTCADFIVSSTDYFRFSYNTKEYISEDVIADIQENTSQSLEGCGYKLVDTGTMAWMSEEAWKMEAGRYLPNESIEAALAQADRRGELISEDIMIEGLDDTLFEKLTVVEGDLSTLLQENSQSIALVADEDDYGNPSIPESYPKPGEQLTITYVEESYYIDSRTGEKSTDDTPEEYMEYYIASSRDVDYTVSAYVTLPYSMSYRYGTLGYNAVLPVNRMEQDSGQKALPMFYLFDTPDADSEEDAEEYLAELTEDDLSALMYESKASIREDFESFQNMFLLLGGVLCAIIGIVGVLNFFNAIMTGIISRRREFAVLQSVGMTNSQLKMMLVYEGMFYALGAAGAALMASVLFTPLTGQLLEKMFWFFSANFTIAPVLFAIPVFMLFGWLIPSMMYGQSMKESVVERLREAE